MKVSPEVLLQKLIRSTGQGRWGLNHVILASHSITEGLEGLVVVLTSGRVHVIISHLVEEIDQAKGTLGAK